VKVLAAASLNLDKHRYGPSSTRHEVTGVPKRVTTAV